MIRRRAQPIYPSGSIAVLRGNLAPRGAIIKQSAATRALLAHTRPRRRLRFGRGPDRAHRRPTLDVDADDVLVLRNAGPIGAPGMPEAGYLPIPKKLAQQASRTWCGSPTRA